MGYNDDVAIFKEYIKNRYAITISVNEKSTKALPPKEDPRIMRWAVAMAEHFNVTVDFLIKRGRERNSYEKAWFRFMVLENENISCNMLARSLRIHHTTILHSISVCKGWIDVYPEVWEAIQKTAEKHIDINKSKIRIVYED